MRCSQSDKINTQPLLEVASSGMVQKFNGPKKNLWKITMIDKKRSHKTKTKKKTKRS